MPRKILIKIKINNNTKLEVGIKEEEEDHRWKLGELIFSIQVTDKLKVLYYNIHRWLIILRYEYIK